MKMLPLGYWTIVIFAVFNAIGAASGQNEKEVFGALGGEVSFGPGKLNPPVTSIIWKQISSTAVTKAIEWDDDGIVIPNPRFQKITDLNTTTGQITIRNLKKNHSGVYTIDINSKEQEQRFRLELLPLVPKPEIKIDRPDNLPNVVYLICEYDGQIIWKNSAGENLVIANHHPKGKFITVKQNGNPESYYTCTVVNAVSNATSDPVYKRDLFEESVPWWIPLIVLFILVLFLFCLPVLLYKVWPTFHGLVFEHLGDKPCIGAVLKRLDGKKNAQPEQEAVYANGEENKRTDDGTDEMLMAKTTEKTPDSAES
ncbi:SLAM family member 7 [Labeo rohita]|uniref:SLAM family member 7 n=1 Tax=Labeo rohita TaxID=84645 RepID=UPI0021E1C884|nr:SLAM family member 7 [Labeo rohita]